MNQRIVTCSHFTPPWPRRSRATCMRPSSGSWNEDVMATGSSIAIRLRRASGWVLLAGLTFAPRISAQTADTSSSQRKTATAREQEEKKKSEDDTGFRWKGFPSWHLGKGTHIDLRARVQFDVRDFALPAHDDDRSEERRVGKECRSRW